MTRTQMLIRRPKAALGVLATALAAVSVAVGSGATFTSSTSNPSNTFTAGTLHQTNTGSGTLVSSTLSGLKPGFGTSGSNTDTIDATSTSAGYGSAVINNDGNLAGNFTVSVTESSSAYSGTSPAASAVCGGSCSALDGALKVRLTKTDATGGEVTVYDGLVSGLTSATGLGTPGATPTNTFSLAAGASRTYKSYFYLPYSTGNAYQGGTANLTLNFAEVQQ